MRLSIFGRRSILAIWFGAIMFCASTGQGQGQVTNNVFLRVRMIRPAGRDFAGTGFTVEVDGRQYLITAKHLVAGMKAEDTLEILKTDQWLPIRVKVFRCSDPVDIAVLVPPRQLTVAFPLEPTMNGIRYAQDVYFAGFPYGLSSTNAQNVVGVYPLAFVKKAILSAIRTQNGVSIIFLDGHNNPGFSGGPIVFRDLTRSDFVYKLAGVVSGFRSELTPVLKRPKR